MHTQNIKMSILPFVLVLALLLPSSALAAQSAADTAPVKAKFSRGGLRLDISNTTPYWALILNMTVTFCDGTSVTGRQLGMFRHYLSESFTYTADKQMRSVVINAVNPAPDERGKIAVVSLRRSCNESTSASPLYCRDVAIAGEIHRSTTEPISFTGPARIYRAGLRLPGVDDLVMTRCLHRTSGYSWQPTVSYNYRTRTWSGVIPNVNIPAGKYRNVELVVQDGYGKQAKCRVVELTVKP
jgi:hypothetical protein